MKSNQKEQQGAEDALERELRKQAASVRRPAPTGLRGSILDRIEGAPHDAAPTARRQAPWKLLALAASLAALAWVVHSSRPEIPPGTGTEQQLASAAPISLDSALARLLAVSPTRLGASVAEPLLAEMSNLARDTQGIALTFYAGVPTPIQNLIGLNAPR